MYQFKRKKHWSTINIYFLPVTITNMSAFNPEQTRLHTRSTNESTGGEKINQTSRKNEDLLRQNRIKREWCVLTVCICAEAAVGGWFVALSLCHYPSCHTKSCFQTIPHQPLFKEGSDELWRWLLCLCQQWQSKQNNSWSPDAYSANEETHADPARPAEADRCG